MKYGLIVIVSLLLTACPGGDDSSPAPTMAPNPNLTGFLDVNPMAQSQSLVPVRDYARYLRRKCRQPEFQSRLQHALRPGYASQVREDRIASEQAPHDMGRGLEQKRVRVDTVTVTGQPTPSSFSVTVQYSEREETSRETISVDGSIEAEVSFMDGLIEPFTSYTPAETRTRNEKPYVRPTNGEITELHNCLGEHGGESMRQEWAYYTLANGKRLHGVLTTFKYSLNNYSCRYETYQLRPGRKKVAYGQEPIRVERRTISPAVSVTEQEFISEEVLHLKSLSCDSQFRVFSTRTLVTHDGKMIEQDKTELMVYQ